MAILIRRYTGEYDCYTKTVLIYKCVDDEGYTFYEAVGQCEGVDTPPHGNWQNDSLDELVKEAKNWL